jgi:hypothetical protein
MLSILVITPIITIIVPISLNAKLTDILVGSVEVVFGIIGIVNQEGQTQSITQIRMTTTGRAALRTSGMSTRIELDFRYPKFLCETIRIQERQAQIFKVGKG